MTPTKSTDTLATLEQKLGPLVRQAGGVLEVGADPADIAERLAAGPKGFRVVVGLDEAEAITGTELRDEAVRETVVVFLQRGRGLHAKAGVNVTTTQPGEKLPSLLDMADDIAQAIRSIAIPDPEGFRLHRALWLPVQEGSPEEHLRTRQMEFTYRRVLPPRFSPRL